MMIIITLINSTNINLSVYGEKNFDKGVVEGFFFFFFVCVEIVKIFL